MDCISPGIYKQLFIYLIPTICIILTNNNLLHPPYLFFYSIFSSMLPPFFSSKTSLIISSFLFFLSIISPNFYYFSYGFILSHAYNSNILISSEKKKLNIVILKIECISFIISQSLIIPIRIQLFISILVIFLSLFAPSIPIESLDPYSSMKSLIFTGKLLPFFYSNTFTKVLIKNEKQKISSKSIFEDKFSNIFFKNKDNKFLKYSTLLSKEYKTYLSSKPISFFKKLKSIFKPDFGLFYFIILLSRFYLWTFIFIIFNFYRFKFTVFLIVFFVLFGLLWEWLGIFGIFTFSGSITFRMMTGYLTYIVIIIIQRYFFFNKFYI